MSVEQAIHQRWQTDFRLAALVPPQRLLTGAAFGNPTLPYVVIQRLASAPRTHTSSGTRISQLRLQFHGWTSDLETGKQLASQVRRRFDRTSFAVSDGRVLNMQQTDEQESLEADGVWHITIDFEVTHQED
jgi:hypothetical protein